MANDNGSSVSRHFLGFGLGLKVDRGHSAQLGAARGMPGFATDCGMKSFEFECLHGRFGLSG